ncbi:MAG TPA: PDZ domain-containing protein [Microbacteriaceae bacterium]|nr:PDZ domain-containing protein [Microbacteriaceae bacterium]
MPGAEPPVPVGPVPGLPGAASPGARQVGGPGPAPVRRGTPRRVIVGWVSLALGVVLLIALGLTPSPYVIEEPGPVFNTLGVDAPVHGSSAAGVDVARNPRPVITIDGHPTYPTSGGLYMLTVSSYGQPGRLPNWLNVVSAWFAPTDAVIPVDVAYPPATTVTEQNRANEALMRSSQEDATAAALHHLGIPVGRRVVVETVTPGMPAAGVLKPADRITAVDGRPVGTVSALKKALAAGGPGVARLGIVRAGVHREVTLRPRLQHGSRVIGVGVTTAYSFPFTVKIRLNEVGGPSAGMMFTLGILDKMTPGKLNGGHRVAGTGTIDEEGTVGAIGGIEQKMAAARAAGARYFLAPRGNCPQVVGHVPKGLQVFAVSNLDGALAVLHAVRTGSSTSALPRCPAA